MKTFENLTIKQVKKEIIAWETSMGSEAKTVEVITIGQDPDEDMYEQGSGHLCERFYAKIMVNDEPKNRGYEWDTEEEDITSAWDEYQDEDDEDEDGLPSNVVARLDYAGQVLDTLELNPLPEVDVNGELPYAVTTIRMDYPFLVEHGSYNVYKIEPAKTWGELLTGIIKVFQREYEAGNAQACHVLSDYVIERIDVHPGDLATVLIGS